MRTVSGILAAVLLPLSALAAAPPVPPQQPVATEFKFELDRVEVDRLNPDVMFVGEYGVRDRGSLVHKRSTFVAEIVRSVQSL